MTTQPMLAASFETLSVRATQVMELIWLLVIFSMPLVFTTPEFMSNGYQVPKVILYRTLVGILGAFWIIEWGLKSESLRWSVYQTVTDATQ